MFAMAIHVVDISGRDLDRLGSYIRQGRYASVDEFLRVAVRNQLVLEASHGDAQGASPNAATANPPREDKPERSDLLIRLEDGKYLAVEAKASPRPGPLFGQFYRFLPLKFCMRMVALEGASRWPPLWKDVLPRIEKGALRAAVALGPRADDGPFSLTTGFPSPGRDAAKSLWRFEAQYLGRLRNDGAADGFGFALAFLASGESPLGPTIGLTEAGRDFTALANPVLDEGKREPLSVHEVRFLWGWLRDNLRDEFLHMGRLLDAVRNGASSPRSLSATMGEFYRTSFSRESWTEPKVNLTRSGCVSRLVEMGIVQPTKDGTRVSYAIDETRLAQLA